MSRQMPEYRRHSNGQAFIKCARINGGKALYLGKFGTPDSRQLYQEMIKRLVVSDGSPAVKKIIERPAELDRTIEGVVDRYTDFAVKHYSTTEGPTKEYAEMVLALSPLVDLFGSLDGGEFSPTHLVAVQEHMLGLGTLCRQTINHRIVRVKRFFRWASKFDEVPRVLYWELKCVDPLPFGRGSEAKDVEPVAWSVVVATMPWLSPVVAAMVQLQAICGMRPQDICRMRKMDIDMTGGVWIYKPPKHKMAHRKKTRLIAIPRIAQRLLAPFLDRPADLPLFSPKESYRASRERMKEARPRKGKIYPSELLAQERRRLARELRGSTRTHRDAFDTDSYRRAIKYALDSAALAGAKVAHWHPHQLRHAISTEVSQTLGEQQAQRWLGHERLETTGIYTQRQLIELVDIASKLDVIWSGSASRIAGFASPLPERPYDVANRTASSSE